MKKIFSFTIFLSSNDESNFNQIWSKISQAPFPVPEILFQKNWKNRCFMKNTTTDHIFAKNGFLDKNTATDWILVSWKFWNPMLWPIKFCQKSRKWPFFCLFSSIKHILKNSILKIKIYDSSLELWKKSRFCQDFPRKIAFFEDFFSIFTIFFPIKYVFANTTRFSC